MKIDLVIVGNLTSDPEFGITDDGTSYDSLTIVNNCQFACGGTEF